MIIEAAKRAAELANAEHPHDLYSGENVGHSPQGRALIKLIQRISDMEERFLETGLDVDLRALILPKPIDPLTEILRKFGGSVVTQQDAFDFRAELQKRGGRIVFDGEPT